MQEGIIDLGLPKIKIELIEEGKGISNVGTVKINEEVLLPDESLKIINHSPDGFAWGYCGSGPAQLALSIMLKYFTKYTVKKHYQMFKTSYVASWQGSCTIELNLNEVINLLLPIFKIDKIKLYRIDSCDRYGDNHEPEGMFLCESEDEAPTEGKKLFNIFYKISGRYFGGVRTLDIKGLPESDRKEAISLFDNYYESGEGREVIDFDK